MIQISQKLATFFGKKYSKNHNIGPWKKQPVAAFAVFAHTRATDLKCESVCASACACARQQS
jgi:hypothetical protein